MVELLTGVLPTNEAGIGRWIMPLGVIGLGLINGNLMAFNGKLMAFNGKLMGFELMGFHEKLMSKANREIRR